jgi:hypothetical protein
MATGGNTGDNVGSIQVAALASHSHDNGAREWNANGSTSYFKYGATGSPVTSVWSAVTSVNVDTGNTGPTGGNETRPINAYVNYCIKE